MVTDYTDLAMAPVRTVTHPSTCQVCNCSTSVINHEILTPSYQEVFSAVCSMENVILKKAGFKIMTPSNHTQKSPGCVKSVVDTTSFQLKRLTPQQCAKETLTKVCTSSGKNVPRLILY